MQKEIMAALAAGTIAIGGTYNAVQSPKETPKIAVNPPALVHVITGKQKHGWGDLADDEKKRLVQMLGSLKGQKIQIVCKGSSCSDLAEDLDDVFEDVGAESSVQTPVFDLGHGIGIEPLNDRTRLIAFALQQVTGGRINLEVFDIPTKGDLIIAIGRLPRGDTPAIKIDAPPAGSAAPASSAPAPAKKKITKKKQ